MISLFRFILTEYNGGRLDINGGVFMQCFRYVGVCLALPQFYLVNTKCRSFPKKKNLGFQDLYTHIPPTSSAIASVLCIHQISFNAKMGGSGLGAKLVLKDRKVRIRFFLGIGRLRLEG